MTTITCASCGTVKLEAAVPCVSCGSVVPHVEVTLGGVQGNAVGGNLGTVAEDRDFAGRPQVAVQTPEGARSHALLDDELVSLDIAGPTRTGRRGEPRARDIFLTTLREQGMEAIRSDGEDSRGEDDLLELGPEEKYTIQMVTVPREKEFWHAANSGSATVKAGVDAGDCIRSAILFKHDNTSPEERPNTVLLLDAAHAGVLADPAVAESYLQAYGDPRKELGFASVWIVGPTPTTTVRVGTGRP